MTFHLRHQFYKFIPLKCKFLDVKVKENSLVFNTLVSTVNGNHPLGTRLDVDGEVCPGHEG